MQRQIGFAISLVTLAAVAGVLVVVPAASRAADANTRVIDRDVDLAGARALTVRGGGADVKVTGDVSRRQAHPAEAGAPAPRGATAHVHVELHGEPRDTAQVAFAVTRDGDQVAVSLDDSKGRPWWSFMRGSSAFSATCEVVLAGDVDVSVRTGSGAIVVADAPRAVSAHAGSGAISVIAPRGAVDAHTGSGDAVVRGATAALAMRTGSGNVEATLADGWAGTGVHLQTGSGSVRLAVPAGLHAALQTRTGSGRVTNDAHTIAANGPVVSVRTGSGDIHIAATTGQPNPRPSP